MAKEKEQVRRSFYRPHKRVQEHGRLFNVHTGEYTTPPSMTKQEFRKESDINNIIKSYSPQAMRNLIAQAAAAGRYEDLPDTYDFQESLHLVEQARAAFMTLPAHVRDRFGQDPARFLAFTSDVNNRQEMANLGLIKQAESSAPIPVTIITNGDAAPSKAPQETNNNTTTNNQPKA